MPLWFKRTGRSGGLGVQGTCPGAPVGYNPFAMLLIGFDSLLPLAATAGAGGGRVVVDDGVLDVTAEGAPQAPGAGALTVQLEPVAQRPPLAGRPDIAGRVVGVEVRGAGSSSFNIVTPCLALCRGVCWPLELPPCGTLS